MSGCGHETHRVTDPSHRLQTQTTDTNYRHSLIVLKHCVSHLAFGGDTVPLYHRAGGAMGDYPPLSSLGRAVQWVCDHALREAEGGTSSL